MTSRIWHSKACKEPPWQPQLDALYRRRADVKRLAAFPKERVLKMFDEHPDWSSGQIAKELGLSSGYIRTTLTRNRRRLARAKVYP